MITKLSNLKKLKLGRKGVTALEYGLIAALIAAVVATGAATLGTTTSAKFTAIAGSISR